MDYRVLKLVPAKWRRYVHDAFKDEDGYWIMFDMEHMIVGYDYGKYTIHEATASEVREVMKQIEVVGV